MAGIVAYGAYVPRYRLNRKTISAAVGWLRAGALPGEKAVANHDEDSLTMAVAAGMDCLNGAGAGKIDGIYFATTTPAYHERQSAAIIAAVLDLRTDIRTADYTDSLKAGTTALLAAADAVQGGAAGSILCCAADCRLGRPGSPQEMVFGDGAAAVVIGSDNVVASLEGSYSLSHDFPDYRRASGDRFVRSSEDRFIREEGYTRFIPEAVAGLLQNCALEAKDIAKIAYPCLNLREHAAIGRRLGFQPEQIQEPLLAAMGEAGAASPLILLVNMLEGAEPGDDILLVSYGNGAEAILFKVTGEIAAVKAKVGPERQASKKELDSYEKYLTFRGLLEVEANSGEVATTQLPLTWRERKTVLGLYGSKCRRCGTPQFPPQRVCVNPACGAVDDMEGYRFTDKNAAIFSFTEDHTAVTINPPLLYAVIDFEGGGRFIFELTDCESGMPKTGMPVKMVLRRTYTDNLRGIVGYFWKAVPIINDKDERE